MRDIPISLVQAIPRGFDSVKRWVVPGVEEWRKANKWKCPSEWRDSDEGRELVEWIHDSLSRQTDLVMLFNQWVITTDNHDDQVLLTLRYGQGYTKF